MGSGLRAIFPAHQRREKQKGVLNVEKKLFVETNDGAGQQLRPVTPNNRSVSATK